ncbi:Peroxidase 52 [Nymphaea thermarum]|nr:Peroxidase 52 [Nymphaea thermarum]
MASFSGLALTLLPIVALFLGNSHARLTPDFYEDSCPDLLSIVQAQVEMAIKNEKRMGASLLRLFFHDCFVNGCDGSVLLDDTPAFVGEKNAAPNANSVRGFEVIDVIKSAVEEACPGVVSCADILAISARDSVVQLGGPDWQVKLGRRDARKASQAAANSSIPPPTSNLSELISSYAAQGLSVQDMVALSGAHTIGKARCTTFRNRIYQEANIDSFFTNTRKPNCPGTHGQGDHNLAPLDIQTPTRFDNSYFVNLIAWKGLLHSDQALFNGGSTDTIVQNYSQNPDAFIQDFVTAMIKMGDIKPLTGRNGEIRTNCRRAILGCEIGKKGHQNGELGSCKHQHSTSHRLLRSTHH